MNKIIKQLGVHIVVISIIMGIISPLGVNAAKKLEIAEWTIEKSGKATVEIDTEVQRSGRSLKFSVEGNAAVSTSVEVKNGETYTLDFFNKSVNAGEIYAFINGKGYSLKPMNNTFDWTHHSFKYTHNGGDGKISISFIVKGKTESYWIDYPIFKDSMGNNLIKNPKFEEIIFSSKPGTVSGETLEEQFYNIQLSDSFTAESLARVQAGFKTIPVSPANNITIDANGDDWSDYNALSLPVLSNQTIILNASEEENVRKNHSEVKLAYDSERLYFYAEVYDEEHVYIDSSSYWQADSIQFTLSRLTDTYGYEIGLVYNSDEDKGSIYSTYLTETELRAMDFAAKREGNITKYEISVPWTIYYGAVCPDDMLFDLLVNDNSGNGRGGCYEFASGGIATNKSNVDFPYMQFLSSDKNWYGWIDGERKPTIGEEEEYSLFLVNYGEEKEFELTLPDGEKDTVTIGKDEGIRYEILHTFSDSGKSKLSIGIDEGDEIAIDVIAMPGMEKVEEYVSKFSKDLKEIELLIKKCKKNEIAYDSENAYYIIAERFIQYMQDDADRDDFSKTDYFIEKIDEILKEAKDNLNGYLSGEKTSVLLPKYILDGEDEIDGMDIVATSELDGKHEKRPMYFIGFGHFGNAAKDIPIFRDLGYNVIQFEVGPSQVLRNRGDVPNWLYDAYGGVDAKMEVSEKEKASGNKSLLITNNTPPQGGVFATLSKLIDVKPNTVYKFGFKIKAKRTEGIWYSLNSFEDRNFLPADVSDWTECSSTFTTGANQTKTTFRLLSEGISQECYIDDVYVYEDGTEENLLENGGFENEDDKIYWEATDQYLSEFLSWLDSLEENNQALSFLISPHYLTDGMKDYYPELKTGNAHTFPGYNVNSDVARQYIEEYLRVLMPYIKDRKTVQSICLANEPYMASSSMPEFYQPKWEEYLKNKYGTIDRLNEAWMENYDSFEGISMPDTQSYDMRFYDYIKFNDIQFTEWFKFMKDIIREYTDVPVHAKLMNTMGEHDHQGVDRRWKMHFGMNPEAFAEFCEISGNDVILYPNWVKAGEQGELEKSFCYDYQTSLRNSPVANTEDHIINDMDMTFDDDFYADFVETDLWQGAFHGRTISNVWTWDRANGNSSSIFNGLFLDRPDAVKAVTDVAMDLNRYSYEVSAVRNEKRDVAILYSISSRVYQQEYMNAVYKTYEACSYNGKHSIIINEEQIDKLSDCDLLIIPHATHCTAAAVEKIKEFIENGGKVLILGSDSLEFTEETQTKNDESVRNYIFANSTVEECVADGNFLAEPSDSELCDIVENFLKDSKKQYVRLIDTDTGDTTENVEWMYGTYNGKIYVNINNYNIDKPLTVNLEIGGKPVENAKELRSQTETGSDIKLEPYSPILLEVEADSVFFDIIGHWSENEVIKLSDKKIVNGVSASRFEPDRKITRAEFLTLVLKAIDVEARANTISYSDVDPEAWYAGVISQAEKIGLTNELENGTNIEPNKSITREEIMTVLVKAFEYKGKSITGDADSSFDDIGNIGEKFEKYVKKAIQMGWIKGDNGKLLPTNLSNRAEAAALIGRFMEDL